MQSKLKSFIESNANTFIGFAGSMLIWEFVVKPCWNLPTSLLDNLTITCLFTVWSIIRGYYVRRFFNWHQHGRKVPHLVASTPERMPLLVGVTGKAGAGKDTVADLLEYPRDAFASTLKAMMAAAGLPEPASREEKEAIIPGLGFSWRVAAQRLGTEWGRGLNENLWVLLLLRRVRASGHPIVCISDVRFENEAALIRSNGVLCHVRGRDTTVVGDAAAHASEAGVDPGPGDYVIHNDGSLRDLGVLARNFKHNYVEPLAARLGR